MRKASDLAFAIGSVAGGMLCYVKGHYLMAVGLPALALLLIVVANMVQRDK